MTETAPLCWYPWPMGWSIYFCLDFHKVNVVSKFDAQPVPRIDELLELGMACFYSTLDLIKG